jgi:hypothetical protein
MLLQDPCYPLQEHAQLFDIDLGTWRSARARPLTLRNLWVLPTKEIIAEDPVRIVGNLSRIGRGPRVRASIAALALRVAPYGDAWLPFIRHVATYAVWDDGWESFTALQAL